MKKLLSILLLCAALLTMLSSCNVNNVPTPEPTGTEGSVPDSYVPTPAPTTTKESDTDITVTPTPTETEIPSKPQRDIYDLIDDVEKDVDGVNKFTRMITVEKPLDEDVDLEKLFTKCCEKYKDLHANFRENGGNAYEVFFDIYGKALTKEDLGGADLPISSNLDEQPLQTRIHFSSPQYTRPAELIDQFTFEMFKEIYEMEEVTKIKITFRTGFGPG